MGDCCGQSFPLAGFGLKLFAAKAGEIVKLCAAIVL
jgi:hypothetical protein